MAEEFEVKSFAIGDVVTGEVTKVEDKQVLVDIGYKVDGIVPISELSSLHIEKTSDVVSVGDQLTLKVKKLDDDEIVLSKSAAVADAAWEDLKAKFETGEVFEAEIKDAVKGGLVVDVGVRGFIPASLVERHFVEDFSDYKGKNLALKVVELDRDKNRLILSHRAVVEEEMSKKKQTTLGSLQEGTIVEGTVQRLTDFGAFIDIGGIDGLVHISQLAHYRVEKPSDIVQEGDKVKVKVLAIDLDNDRISLSIKDTLPGPWEQVEEQVKAGDVLEGTVKRLVSFGAFVEVLPSIEGLVHISQIANRHIGTPHEVLEEGQTVQVKVLDVNKNERRISLSIRDLLDDQDSSTDYGDYQMEEDAPGFQLGDMIGDQLKKLK